MLKNLQTYRKITTIRIPNYPSFRFLMLTFYHICYIILSLSHIYGRYDAFYVYLLSYVSPKHKGILLDNYGTVIKIGYYHWYNTIL